MLPFFGLRGRLGEPATGCVERETRLEPSLQLYDLQRVPAFLVYRTVQIIDHFCPYIWHRSDHSSILRHRTPSTSISTAASGPSVERSLSL